MDHTQRFTDRAGFYARWRPSYPPDLLNFLRRDLQLPESCAIADIGSGTGILTELLLQIVGSKGTVYAVEPNAPMREIAEKALSGHANFKSLAAAAEATTLPDGSVDLITAGQAFHWFDRPKTKVEFTRILKPRGWVALIWNERRTTGNPFGAAYNAFVDEFESDRLECRHQALSSGDLAAFKEFFALHKFDVACFDNYKSVDLEGLTGLILSSSAMPLPGHAKFAGMSQAIPQLFAAHQQSGQVTIEYDTRVYYGRL